jgi:hypothetical protein
LSTAIHRLLHILCSEDGDTGKGFVHRVVPMLCTKRGGSTPRLLVVDPE